MTQPKCYTMTMEERKAELAKLVERFAREKEFYKSKQFNEANTRLNFIDPFLELLGWDVKNEEGKTESFKNVKIETNQLQGNNVKHPDYALRLGAGQTILYVEAKQPSINLKENPEPALQVRRYGYTSKLKLSILTDFEEFCVYDTTIKPKPTDKVGVARIQYYTFDQYLENFETIYNRYSFEACNTGKMTFFAESASDKKGTSTIDDDILQMIEEWRILLANDIALNNSQIDEYDLTSAVQKIIDRIIFLRICEDKNIEEFGTLKNIRHCEERSDEAIHSTYYKNLKKIFSNANQKYNSGLFEENEFLNSINISDKVLTKMINSLYYPECQYEFSVLPVEILGTIYERFLGKIIQYSRKTKNGHSITVIEKPEVQKAGGVYYTPRYIVEYIVEQTIGAKIKDKTPEEISKMRFVDPACGSGSFLVGAYDYLLRYHLDYYTRHCEEANKNRHCEEQSDDRRSFKREQSDKATYDDKIFNKALKNGIIYKDAQSGEYKLSVAEKKRILVNNIYGVDLDLQATEVSKVSLFLKLLEDEGQSLSGYGQAEMFKESDLSNKKILPNMSANIKCGNSLVETDFMSAELFQNKAEFVKVRPFDWEKEFSAIASEAKQFSGMFDCVIGNPPYVNVENLNEQTKDYLFDNYRTCKGRTDLYVAFIEKSLTLLKKDGTNMFIIPYSYTNQNYAELSRMQIVQNNALIEIVDTSNYMVFSNANVKNIILHIGKTKTNNNTKIKIVKSKEDFEENRFEERTIATNSFLDLPNCRFETKDFMSITPLKNKIETNTVALGKICLVAYGVRVNHKKDKDKPKKYYISETKENGYKEFCEGRDIERYFCMHNSGFLNYCPNEHYNPMFPELFENEKIMFINVVSDRLRFAYDTINTYNSHTVVNCVRIDKLKSATHISARKILKENDADFASQFDVKFLLGILNSAVLNWYFLQFLSEGLHFYPDDAKQLPIPLATPAQQQSLAALVDQMLQTQAQLHGGLDCHADKLARNDVAHGTDSTPLSASDKQFLEQKATMLDKQINEQVYKLYNLTPEEINIVEDK